MELHFIEGMRRRWNVLGISFNEGAGPTNKKQRMEVDIDVDDIGDPIIIDDNQEKPPDEIVAAEHGGDEGEAARRAIMEGAIVKSAMSNAAKGMSYYRIVQAKGSSAAFEAVPRIQLFSQLENLIRTQPCQHSLRANLMDELYFLLQKTIPGDPEAIKMQATRRLRELASETAKDKAETNRSENENMVDSIQYANEQLVHAVSNPPSDNARPQISVIYADFVKEWCQSPTLDPTLVNYSFWVMNLVADGQPFPEAIPGIFLARDGSTARRFACPTGDTFTPSSARW